MYFKLQQTAPLYATMKAIIDRFKTCDAAHYDFQVSIGAKARVYYETGGRTIGYEFEADPSPSLGLKFSKKLKCWMPDLRTKTGRTMQDKMNALPLVTQSEINAALDYKSYTRFVNGRMISSLSPGIQMSKNKEVILFDYPDGYPHPMPEGMEEITYTEYSQLTSK